MDGGEKIILKQKNVTWIVQDLYTEYHIKDLTLTDKRIMGTYKKQNGLFKKASDEFMEIPFSEIVRGNGGAPAVSSWDITHGWHMEIITLRGKEIFKFEDSRKYVPIWVSEINGLVLNKAPFEAKRTFADKIFDNFRTKASDAKAGTDDAFYDTFYSSSSNKRRENGSSDSSSSVLYCSHCGTKLAAGSRFCQQCGAAVISEENTNGGSSGSQNVNYNRVHKCPNCGSTVPINAAVCPYCHSQFAGRKATQSVKELTEQLLKIEQSRRDVEFMGVHISSNADNIQRQKLQLIKNFPIPNTVDDIQEFALLSITNINVPMSMQSRGGWFRSTSTNTGIEKEISDAWVVKLKQTYTKAKLLFPEDPAFKNIEALYLDMMTKLNMEP